MAFTTVSVLASSIPSAMTHGANESLPRAWGNESELRALGLERGYSKAQEAGIIKAANDYLRFQKENKLSWWSKNVLERKEQAKEMSQSEAAVESEILAHRRMEMLAALREIVLAAEM